MSVRRRAKTGGESSGHPQMAPEKSDDRTKVADRQAFSQEEGRPSPHLGGFCLMRLAIGILARAILMARFTIGCPHVRLRSFFTGLAAGVPVQPRLVSIPLSVHCHLHHRTSNRARARRGIKREASVGEHAPNDGQRGASLSPNL